jgi:hypothetical protein
MDWKDKRVAVIGLARSGLAAAKNSGKLVQNLFYQKHDQAGN